MVQTIPTRSPKTSNRRQVIILLAMSVFLLLAILVSQTAFDLTFLRPGNNQQIVVFAALSALIFLLFVALTFVLFRNLLKVSGVGPRIALAILSGGTAATFAHAVREHDAAALTRIPGVGRKIAERLIVEMRDRIEATDAGPDASAATAAGHAAGAEAEAYGALVSLGYKPGEATRLLRGVGVGVGAGLAGLSTEELIRRALQGAVRA